MMKKPLLALLITLLPSIVSAQSEAWIYTNPLSLKIYHPYGFSSFEALAAWAGCPGIQVTLEKTNSRINASYSHYGGISLYGGLLTHFDDEEIAFIFLHEVGHCIQDQLGMLNYITSYDQRKYLEFQADAFAMKLSCVLGRTGARLEHQVHYNFAELVHRPYDLETLTHGSTISRTAWATQRSANSCRPAILSP